MIEDILRIHELVEKNKNHREQFVTLLKNGQLTPSEFINNITYESFDCIGQSKLLLLKCRSNDVALHAIHFVSKLKRPFTAPITERQNKKQDNTTKLYIIEKLLKLSRIFL